MALLGVWLRQVQLIQQRRSDETVSEAQHLDLRSSRVEVALANGHGDRPVLRAL